MSVSYAARTRRSQFQNGKLDDVRSYNRALSPTQIQQLYNLGTVIVRPN